MNNDNEVLGTYITEMTTDVRAGSPELEEVLAAVTGDGLARQRDIICITGDRLASLIAARQKQLIEEAERCFPHLSDEDLVKKCQSDSYAESALASELLIQRVNDGHDNAFAALVDASAPTSVPFNYPLNPLLTSLVEAKRDAVKSLSNTQLNALVSDGVKSPISFAAKERLDFLATRARDLQVIKDAPLSTVIARYEAGHFDNDKHVKKKALARLKKETLSEQQLGDLLPPMPTRDLEKYLSDLNVPRLGYLSCRSPTCRGILWDAVLVMERIQYTPARLLKRARAEFGGRLPEALHSAMILASKDRYQLEYFDWLSTLSKSSAGQAQDPVRSSEKSSSLSGELNHA